MTDFGIEGLNELQNTLNNLQNQAGSVDCELHIDTNSIIKNVNSFNETFSTNFSESTSQDEFSDYFKEEYMSLFTKHLLDNVDFKNEFNNKFTGYAHID